MQRVVRFPRHLTVTPVLGDGVYLTSDFKPPVKLKGELIEDLAEPLSIGTPWDEILSTLSGKYSKDRIASSLKFLESSGYISSYTDDSDDNDASFHDAVMATFPVRLDHFPKPSISIIDLSAKKLDRDELQIYAANAGLKLVNHKYEANLIIVFVDDYLSEDIGSLRDQMNTTKQPWMLVKASGAVKFIGPIFSNEMNGCYECLRFRMAKNNSQRNFVSSWTESNFPASTADTKLTRSYAAMFGIIAARKWISDNLHRQVNSSGGSVLRTIDSISMIQQDHRLLHRPQCSFCGSPKRQSELQEAPIVLSDVEASNATDGGRRIKDPDLFLKENEHLISPLIGIVSELTVVPTGIEGMHVYSAGPNLAIQRGGRDLTLSLRSENFGKGISELQAKASAFGEAIERYSGVYHGDEPTTWGTIDQIGPLAIDANEFHLYSDRQFDEKIENNEHAISKFHHVGDQLPPNACIEWSPVWSLARSAHRYIPTAAAYFSYPASESYEPGADSNGCAAGTSIEDAILQGILELVERDSVAIWWYNMIQRPEIDLTTFDNSYFSSWTREYEKLGRKCWILDITNDTDIPSVVAISYKPDSEHQDILLSFGSHFDIEIAISRAMSEMNQFLPAVLEVGTSSSESRYKYGDTAQVSWWSNATIENQPYLVPSSLVPKKVASDYYDSSDISVTGLIERSADIFQRLGLELLVMNQTRVDIGIPVVRVLAPGLRHFWPRFGPGRLYDVPVKLGWLVAAKKEEELNPIGMMI